MLFLFPTDLTLTGSEFHRVGAATEIALVSTFVLTLGTKGRLELDDGRCLGCFAGVSSECKHADCLKKNCTDLKNNAISDMAPTQCFKT